MKSNKEKIYEFIQMHESNDAKEGIATSYIADTLSLQRTNVSSILNTLVAEGRVEKTNGRPVRYYTMNKPIDESGCFQRMIGYDGSLKHAIQLAKAAILYPGQSLNILITGDKGVGKKRFAGFIYEYAIEAGTLAQNAPFIQMNCRDYQGDKELAENDLFGKKEDGLIHQAMGGVLYLDNVQYLDGKLLRKVAKTLENSKEKGFVVASCTVSTKPSQEEFQTAFPVLIFLPKINERPISERMEIIEHLFLKEAARVGRTILVKEELMQCLLLYKCDENYRSLKRDIKMGCANAYVREINKQDKITLYISDFDKEIRQGFLQYGERRQELERLIPQNATFTFDGDKMSVEDLGSKNIYRDLRDKASRLAAEGIPQDDIKILLESDVERLFEQYQEDLTAGVKSRKELSVLVDRELVLEVEELIKQAEKLQKRRIDENVLFGLSLHMKNLIHGDAKEKSIDKTKIAEFVTEHKEEYKLSAAFAEKIGEKYQITISTDELMLIAMFLSYEPRGNEDAENMVLLYAFYGVGVASSITKTITDITGYSHVYSYEVSYKRDEDEIYKSFLECVSSIDQGKGVCIVYDSDLIERMAERVAQESGVMIRLFPAPVTTMGIELARKALVSPNLDMLYQEAMRDVGAFSKSRKRYIVTLCTTGKGGAEELKRYIERYGNLEGVEVIPLSMSDEGTLKEAFSKLMRKGTIKCVVGTFNPGLYSIPFCSIKEVFASPKDRLSELLLTAETKDFEMNYDEVYQYLGEQFVNIDIDELKPLIEQFIIRVNDEIKHLTRDMEVGLLMHTACAAERLASKENSLENPQKTIVLRKYKKEFQQILRLLKPIEKTFHIIFNDDEISYILMILYQI